MKNNLNKLPIISFQKSKKILNQMIQKKSLKRKLKNNINELRNKNNCKKHKKLKYSKNPLKNHLETPTEETSNLIS